MNPIIKTYLEAKNCKTQNDYYSTLREILQNILLVGLKNGGFFKNASFYGGTALRIFYGIDRFSEDLDFTLNKSDDNFTFDKYFSDIKAMAESYGFNIELNNVDKVVQKNIVSAFLKADTSVTMINFNIPKEISNLIPSQSKIKIKFEVDIHPPQGFNTEIKTLFFPETTNISVLDIDSLFAGKIAAILCRNYKFNVKGRDYYDFLYFIGLGAKVNFTYLKNKLDDNNYNLCQNELNLSTLKALLKSKFETIDIDKVQKDVMPFIYDKNKLNGLNKTALINSLEYIR